MKTKKSNSSLNSERVSHPQFENYLSRRENVCRKLEAIGESLKGIRFSEETFRNLDTIRQEKVILGLEKIEAILDSSSHANLGQSGHFYIRMALKKYGWKVDPSVFDSISDGDSVEIWGRDLCLKVANIEFMRVCTYAFEEALCYEFWELFERDENYTQRLLELASGYFSKSPPRGATLEPLPPHEVREVFSNKKRRFWVEARILAPVIGVTRQVDALMVVFRVRVL